MTASESATIILSAESVAYLTALLLDPGCYNPALHVAALSEIVESVPGLEQAVLAALPLLNTPAAPPTPEQPRMRFGFGV